MSTLPAQPVNHQQARSQQTRGTILEAAERVFGGSGLAGARMDAIAAEAGVNKALLYYYFKSKDDLYHAVIEEEFRGFNERAMAILTSAGPARAILLEYVSMHFDFISQRKRHASLHQQMMMTGGKPLERLVKQYFAPRSEALGKLLDRGMKQREFRKADRFHTAVSIVATIVFYFSAAPIFQMLGHTDAYSDDALKIRKKELLDFIRHGLFADPEAPLP